MTLNPDRLLMEHVFRPIVDRMAERAGNFILARFCLIGAAFCEMMVLLLMLRNLDTPAFWPQIWVSVALGGVITALNRFSYVMQDIARRGFAPSPYIWPYVVSRILALVAVATVTVAGVSLPFLHTPDFMFAVLVLVCLTSGMYFLHCVMPPRVRPAIHRFRMARRARIA